MKFYCDNAISQKSNSAFENLNPMFYEFCNFFFFFTFNEIRFPEGSYNIIAITVLLIRMSFLHIIVAQRKTLYLKLHSCFVATSNVIIPFMIPHRNDLQDNPRA